MRLFKKKSGFGIVEVMIAAVVLGFLYMAVLNLQTGNRDALLRIRGRDGATEVAQNIIDALGALGLASLSDATFASGGTDDSKKNIKDALNLGDDSIEFSGNSESGNTISINSIKRSWKGQPGLISHDMNVLYDANVKVSPDSEYVSKNTTNLLAADGDTVAHVYAKRLDVTVSWKFKNSRQSVTVSGVVR